MLQRLKTDVIMDKKLCYCGPKTNVITAGLHGVFTGYFNIRGDSRGFSEHFEIHGDPAIHRAGSHHVISMIFHTINANMPATGFL